MITCALCLKERNPRSNTHYLTDAIIRTALNQNGVKDRDYGYYMAFDSNKPFADFKFQRATSTEKLESLLGRPVTEEEMQKSKDEIDFSVNDKFCNECEENFGVIEKAFIPVVLKLFRNQDLNELTQLPLDENKSKILRLFFLLQVWRTSVCDKDFNISNELSEFLREKIYHGDFSGLESIPLSITYLQTLPDEIPSSVQIDPKEKDAYKTSNWVSPMGGKNPNIIFMNDFVIQLYEDLSFPFDSFYGLNEKENYIDFLNYNKENFKVKVIPHNIRLAILKKAAEPLVKNMEDYYRNAFIEFHKRLTFSIPSRYEIAAFMHLLLSSNNLLTMTMEGYMKSIEIFYGIKGV
jgi:hypothetical protein